MNQHDDTPNSSITNSSINGGITTIRNIMGDTGQQPRARRWVKAGVAVALLGALAVAGASFANNGDNNSGNNGGNGSDSAGEGHFGMGRHHHGRNMDPATMSKHIDGMVNHILADGTPEQKTKVSGILKAALTDLTPLRTQHQAAHQEVLKLLSQPTIDRVALEKVRASEIQLADQASRRITQAVEDAADVLTPQQRTKLIDHLKNRMG
jgi:protein CpxP